MRLCLVSQEYPPQTAKGGIGTQTHLKAHALARMGHEITVISGSADGSRHEYAESGVTVVRIPQRPLPTYTDAASWLMWSAAVAEELASVHDRKKFELVDFPEWGCEGYVHLINQTEWNRLPTVLHLHGPLIMFAHTMGWPEFHSDFFKVGTHMEEMCVKLADAIFSSSDTSARWVAKYYDAEREKIPVIHTGVDTDAFRPMGEKAKQPTVVFVGKIVRNKGVNVLAEAVCRIAAELPGVKLRFIGKGEKEVVAELEAIAKRHGKPGVLEFAGFVHREQLPAELSKGYVFAAPSKYEGGPGFVYLEAMACGLPVIACEGSGAAEVVVPDLNGYLVPADNADALVAALRPLLLNEELAARVGRDAREYVIENARSTECMKKMEAFYASVIERTSQK
jgi:glycosyltransferase involved in cell wall biosynthesis